MKLYIWCKLHKLIPWEYTNQLQKCRKLKKAIAILIIFLQWYKQIIKTYIWQKRHPSIIKNALSYCLIWIYDKSFFNHSLERTLIAKLFLFTVRYNCKRICLIFHQIILFSQIALTRSSYYTIIFKQVSKMLYLKPILSLSIECGWYYFIANISVLSAKIMRIF